MTTVAPIATVRTVTLMSTSDGKVVWCYDDDGTAYSAEFATAADAKAWLFTPVAVDATTKPEPAK